VDRNSKDITLLVVAILFLGSFAYIEIKAGLRAIRKRERSIGIYEPKLRLPVGLFLLACGIFGLVVLVLRLLSTD